MWRAFKVILVSVCAVAGVYIWTALTLHVQLDDSTAEAHFNRDPSQHSKHQQPSSNSPLKTTPTLRNISKPISPDTLTDHEPRKSRVESATQLYIFLTEGNETTVRWNPVDACNDWKTIRHTNLPGSVSLLKQNDSVRKSVLTRNNRVQYENTVRNADVNAHSRLMFNCDGSKSPLKSRTTLFTPLSEHYLFSAYYDDRLAAKDFFPKHKPGKDPDEGHSQSSSANRTQRTPVIRILAILKRLSSSSASVKHAAEPSGMFCYIPIDSTTPPSESVIHGNGEPIRNASLINWLAKHTLKVPIELYEMCENHGKQYGGWMLMCSVPASLGLRRPCSIYISTSESSSSLMKRRKTKTHGEEKFIVRLVVFHIDPKLSGPLQKGMSKKPPSNFALCVPPLFGRIDVRTFAQFVELSSLLGADHVIMYVRDPIPSSLQALVRHYEKTGVLSVIGWNVPVPDADIWYNGQLVAINDCLYRSMHAFSHVAFNDLDEFIVPRGASSNWNNMLEDINNSYYFTTSQHNPSENIPQSTRMASNNVHCGFSFKSAFFEPMTTLDEDDVTSTGGPVVTYELESTMRTRMFSAVRTKVMVVPRAVFELGIHHVSRLMESVGGSEDNWGCNVSRGVAEVNPTVAYVHHYRQCVKHFDATMDCEDACHDDTMSQYIQIMRRNVRRTLRNISSP